MKKIIVLCCAVIAVVSSVFIVRYSQTTKLKTDFVYNGYSSEFICDDDRYYYTKNQAPEISGKVSFDLEMFSDSTKMPMYSDGENVFFITESGGIYYYDKCFNIHTLMPEKKSLLQSDSFVDLQENYLTTPTQFVVLGRYIYLYCPGGVFKYDLITHTKSAVFEGNTNDTSFSYSDGKIYFLDFMYNFYCYDTESQKPIDVNINPCSFCTNERGILFSDFENGMSLSFYDLETQKTYLIKNEEITAFDCDSEAVYYSLDGKYYRCGFGGENETLLGSGDVTGNLKKGSDGIYISCDTQDGVEVKRVNLKN